MINRFHPFAFFKIVTASLCVFASAGLFGAQPPGNGRLDGKAVSAATGEGLLGVNVVVKGTWLGDVTSEDGRFSVDRIPAGFYDVEASLMGYEKQRLTAVEVKSEQTFSVAFRLKQSAIQGPTEVVTASKRKQAIEDASTTVDVVGVQEIQSRNATTLDQVLQNTAGMGIIDGQIDLRGSTGFNWSAGSRVLLLMDGHPLINGDTGGINWDAIPIEVVERVEVVKGAGSALYGSNAMAGMVNVITRDPSEDPETRIRMTYGFYDVPAYNSWRWTDRFLLYRLWKNGKLDFNDALSFKGVDVSHSRSFGNVGLLFTLGRKTSTEYHQNGGYRRWNAMGKVKVKLSPRQSLTLSANWADNNHGEMIQWLSQSHPLEVPPSELGNSVSYSKANASATYRHVVNHALAYTLKANWYRNYWKNDYQDNKDYALTNKFGTEAQADLLWKGHAFTFGCEAVHDRADSKIFGNPETLDLALYGEDELKFARTLILTLGMRYDFHRVPDVYSDGEINPRLGLVFRPAGGTSIRLSAGHGFRAPSIAEVFADVTVSGVRVVKNLDLRKAERAWSYEIGASQTVDLRSLVDRSGVPLYFKPLQWAAEQLRPEFLIDASLFYTRYENMIDVDFNPNVMAFQFMNMGGAKTQGVELRLKTVLLEGRVSGQAGYTYLDASDLETGNMLHYRSRHRLNTGIVLRTGKLSFGLDYRYAGRIETVINLYGEDERVPMHVMDGRILLDLKRIDFALECNNLRNYHYTLRQRFLEPLRSYSLTTRIKL